MTGCTARRYDQFETSPEAIEQELRPAVCERHQTDIDDDGDDGWLDGWGWMDGGREGGEGGREREGGGR